MPILILGLLCLLGGCERLSNLADERALRKQCHIPPYAQSSDYKGFPAMSGFGQREGLSITARFRIPKSNLDDFEKFMHEDGWDPLPVSAELRARLPRQGKGYESDLEAVEGFFRCHTAGSEVLHAKTTYSCA